MYLVVSTYKRKDGQDITYQDRYGISKLETYRPFSDFVKALKNDGVIKQFSVSEYQGKLVVTARYEDQEAHDFLKSRNVYKNFMGQFLEYYELEDQYIEDQSGNS